MSYLDSYITDKFHSNKEQRPSDNNKQLEDGSVQVNNKSNPNKDLFRKVEKSIDKKKSNEKNTHPENPSKINGSSNESSNLESNSIINQITKNLNKIMDFSDLAEDKESITNSKKSKIANYNGICSKKSKKSSSVDKHSLCSSSKHNNKNCNNIYRNAILFKIQPLLPSEKIKHRCKSYSKLKFYLKNSIIDLNNNKHKNNRKKNSNKGIWTIKTQENFCLKSNYYTSSIKLTQAGKAKNLSSNNSNNNKLIDSNTISSSLKNNNTNNNHTHTNTNTQASTGNYGSSNNNNNNVVSETTSNTNFLLAESENTNINNNKVNIHIINQKQSNKVSQGIANKDKDKEKEKEAQIKKQLDNISALDEKKTDEAPSTLYTNERVASLDIVDRKAYTSKRNYSESDLAANFKNRERNEKFKLRSYSKTIVHRFNKKVEIETIVENKTLNFSKGSSSSIKATIEPKSKPQYNYLENREQHKSVIDKNFSIVNVSSITSINSSNTPNNREYINFLQLKSNSSSKTRSKRSHSSDVIFSRWTKNFIESRLNSDKSDKSDKITIQTNRSDGVFYVKRSKKTESNSLENQCNIAINKINVINKSDTNFLGMIENQINTQIDGSLWQDAVIRANKEAREESIPSDIYSNSKFVSSSSNNNNTNSLETDTYFLNTSDNKLDKINQHNKRNHRVSKPDKINKNLNIFFNDNVNYQNPNTKKNKYGKRELSKNAKYYHHIKNANINIYKCPYTYSKDKNKKIPFLGRTQLIKNSYPNSYEETIPMQMKEKYDMLVSHVKAKKIKLEKHNDKHEQVIVGKVLETVSNSKEVVDKRTNNKHYKDDNHNISKTRSISIPNFQPSHLVVNNNKYFDQTVTSLSFNKYISKSKLLHKLNKKDKDKENAKDKDKDKDKKKGNNLNNFKNNNQADANKNKVNVIKTNVGDKKINERENAIESNEEKSPPDNNSNSSVEKENQREAKNKRRNKQQLFTIEKPCVSFSLIPVDKEKGLVLEENIINIEVIVEKEKPEIREADKRIIEVNHNEEIPEPKDVDQIDNMTGINKEFNNFGLIKDVKLPEICNSNSEINIYNDVEQYYKIPKLKLTKKKVSDIIESVKVIDERFYSYFIQSSLSSLISIQQGSFAMQRAVTKFTSEALNDLIKEVSIIINLF